MAAKSSIGGFCLSGPAVLFRVRLCIRSSIGSIPPIIRIPVVLTFIRILYITAKKYTWQQIRLPVAAIGRARFIYGTLRTDKRFHAALI
jgi:hypothetical protein